MAKDKEELHSEDLAHFKQYLEYFVESDPDLQLKDSHFSTAAVNSFIDFVSSSRGIMSASQISQALVLSKPLLNMIQNTTMYELGKYAITKKTESKVEVLAIIKRRLHLESPITERILIYRDLESGVIDAMELPLHHKMHNYFGFEFNIDENIDNYSRGKIIEKDTIIAKSNSIGEDGSYSIGRDVNIALMSYEEDDEDGFIVSDKFLDDFKFDIFETYKIEGGSDSFFLNIYGTKEKFKAIPEVGDTINPNGLVFATRDYDNNYGPGLYSAKDIMKCNPIFDTAVYGRSGIGIVTDVKVFKNNKRKKTLPIGTNELLDGYANALVSYYKQIINIYESLNSDHRNRFGEELAVGNTFNTLIIEAYGIVESSAEKSKLKKMYRKEILDLYRIEVVVKYTMTPNIGFKPTDMAANKGTIVTVKPWLEMPVDADGNRADIVMDPKSTTSRLNDGRVYEIGIKGALLKLKKILVDEVNDKNIDLSSISDKDIKSLFSIILEFINILENKQTDYYNKIYSQNNLPLMLEEVRKAVEDVPRIVLNVGGKPKWLIIEDIRNSRFNPTRGKVNYIINGEKKTSKDDILIAPIYIILLSKIADDVLATSSAAVNHYGIPTVVSKKDKQGMPHKNSPIRVAGESEARVFVSMGGEELMAEIKDMNTSIGSHSTVYGNVLTADKPTDIDTVIDRKSNPYGTDRGIEILSTLYSSVGLELKYIKDKERYVEVDNTKVQKEFLNLDKSETVEEIS